MKYKIEELGIRKYKLTIEKKDIPYNLEVFKEELEILGRKTAETETNFIVESRVPSHLEMIIKTIERNFKPKNDKYCDPYFQEEIKC